MIFENLIRAEVRAEVVARFKTLARFIGCSADDIAIVVKGESSFNLKAYNSSGGASGWFQWMPATAADLGTTTAQIRNMNELQQLDLYEKYIRRLGLQGKIRNVLDLYLANFFPAAVGQKLTFLIADKDGKTDTRITDTAWLKKVYSQNAGLDQNKDGRITVGDIQAWCKRIFPEANFNNTEVPFFGLPSSSSLSGGGGKSKKPNGKKEK
ncbi:transglycosylase SLT domain-containing protein [Siphonobacter aquaeclarae]|uniref:Transglycosylase SLT domain-containing protein n=1 Tax=Siphonobacter aquaeclarae TaxID=563176 RepID=A0A1G9T9M4_9BACT|nr:transglycosylase SLT domain-containing protein [Siphonobacter aquaeclarae]SDM44469.1 hypothetical protein SAMN04488090_3475 [Siphonobacter aquaeclarae]